MMNTQKKTNLDLKFKRSKSGPEAELVKSFVNSSSGIFENRTLKMKIFQEPFIGISIPDLVIVFWDESLLNDWESERNCLEMHDIKILHHMFLNNDFVDTDSLKNSLGYPVSQIERTIERLMKAGLLVEKSKKFKPGGLEKIFFVKIIISIEAKIKTWKKAFEQAWLNDLFASESYVLLPHNRINSQIVKYSKKSGIGLLGHQEKVTKIVSKPIRKEIPSSYTSWLFNEYIGRELYYEL